MLGDQLTSQPPGNADVSEVIHDGAEDVPLRFDRQTNVPRKNTGT
jgi:hypothetical protein